MSPRQRGPAVRAGQLALILPLLLAPTAPPAVAAVQPAAAPPVHGEVTVDEGTDMAVTVSGDGNRMAVDLQGFLWTLPADGGTATRRSDAELDPALPDWSPTDERIVFQSYKQGTFDVYTAAPDGSGLRQVTSGPADDREPRFSPDGTKVAFASDRAREGNYDIWVADLATGDLTRWTDAPAEEYQPTWSPDGTEIGFVSGDIPVDGSELVAREVAAVDADGNRRSVATEEHGQVFSPSWSPSGEHLAYVHMNEQERLGLVLDGQTITPPTEDVFPFPVEWTGDDQFVYTADGHIKRHTLGGGTEQVPFSAQVDFARDDYTRAQHDFDRVRPRKVQGIVAPKLSPDGQQVAFSALGDLWVLDMGNPRPTRLTTGTYLENDPSWTADGNALVYSSDRAGSSDLWRVELRTGAQTRLTDSTGEEIAPAVSPDGSKVAYQDQVGATHVLELESGTAQQVDGERWLPGHPSWAPDSRHLTWSVVQQFSDRFREGTSQILVADTAAEAGSESTQVFEPAPYRSLSTRGVDGPVWSPDGDQMAFVMESRLHTVPVDASGRPTGEPTPVTDEVTDAVSYSGDGETLLYLSNGTLRTVPADGSGEPTTVPLELRYRPQRQHGQVVVHAGALWDGKSRKLRRNVDIVVRDNRIAAVRDHRDTRHRRARVVDASGKTVMPGLIDTHIHNDLWGKAMGARKGRLYLAYGVTTARSLGDPAYDAIEDAESYEAGTQAGPRFFPTGEAIDGSRVYYDFMRPTLDEAQLRRLELDRARALSYDILKAYVRLPADLNKIVVAAAHAMGVPNLSHYLYPGAAYGQDGQSHISATQRLGYSRSQSLSGVSYDDMTTLFAASRTTVIPTLFDSSTLFAEDDSVVTDERARALMPAWYYASMLGEAERARSTDQSVTRRNLRDEVHALRRVIANGGVVAAGTDAPLDQVGLATHMNLRAMVRYGMDEYTALRTATAEAAKVLGESDDLGTVSAGNLADLVAVEGNPLTDIGATHEVAWTMKGGRRWSVPQLMAPYTGARSVTGTKVPAGPSAQTLTRLPEHPRLSRHEH